MTPENEMLVNLLRNIAFELKSWTKWPKAADYLKLAAQRIEALVAESTGLTGDDLHPENRCGKCGGRNICWFVESSVWNSIAERHEILCPICFVRRVEADGKPHGAWELIEQTENRLDLQAKLAAALADRRAHGAAVRERAARQLEVLRLPNLEGDPGKTGSNLAVKNGAKLIRAIDLAALESEEGR